MGGLINALNAGKTSMATSQKAMEIVGNNIANVNTPGYSRQTPHLTPFPTLSFGDFFIGQGVRVGSIERAHNAFISRQITNKTADLGYEQSKTAPLAAVERALPVDEGGLSATLDRFFDSWQELSTNPNGQVERQLVRQNGQNVADAFLTTANDLQSVRIDIDNQLASKIDGVNQQLQEIAELNNRISAIELSGNSANSDRDRRDILLGALSTALGAQSTESKDGMVSIQLPTGIPLLSGTDALKVEGINSGTTLQLQVRMNQTTFSLDAAKVGGEFQGLLDVRDNLVPDLLGRLDQMAFDISTAMNQQHRLGTGLDGVTNRDFFTPQAGVSGAASSLSVALTSNQQIAAGTGSAPGDNSNALEIAALKQTNMVSGTDTYASWFGKLTATSGMEANQNQLFLTGLQDTMTQLNNVRDATVGVSLDEEMISLIQYQKSFEASAKFLATIDEMMGSLLAIKR